MLRSGGNALPWTSATKVAQPGHAPGKSPLSSGNIRRFAELPQYSASNSSAKYRRKVAVPSVRIIGHNVRGLGTVWHRGCLCSPESEYRAHLYGAKKMSVGPCSIDQNNAAPLKEASRNPDGSRVVDRARSFRPYGLRHTRNRVAQRWQESCSLSYVRRCRRDH